MGDEIRTTLVPSRYGANLFALRAHHRLLLDRLTEIEETGRFEQGPTELEGE